MVRHVFLVRAVIENKPKAKDPEGKPFIRNSLKGVSLIIYAH